MILYSVIISWLAESWSAVTSSRMVISIDYDVYCWCYVYYGCDFSIVCVTSAGSWFRVVWVFVLLPFDGWCCLGLFFICGMVITFLLVVVGICCKDWVCLKCDLSVVCITLTGQPFDGAFAGANKFSNVCIISWYLSWLSLFFRIFDWLSCCCLVEILGLFLICTHSGDSVSRLCCSVGAVTCLTSLMEGIF